MAEARLKAVPLLLCAVFPPLPLENTQRSRLTRPEWLAGSGCLTVACKMISIGI